jgi:lysine 2,3-aminomutase
MSNSIHSASSLFDFLNSVLPARIQMPVSGETPDTTSVEAGSKEFIQDVKQGMQRAPMAVRLTPHVLSLIDWSNPYTDPIRRQFVPLSSSFREDHPKLKLDSLHETEDSPVKGLVHRYPDKVLFLGICVLRLQVCLL